jgi:tRNA(Ile2) C34 agmatinyltransferase TiaS
MAAINPTCPFCGRRKGIRPAGPDTFKCPACGALFDDDPDEGGTYSNRNPAARLEREDRERQRKLSKIGQRKGANHG